jgi:hypothetical protein
LRLDGLVWALLLVQSALDAIETILQAADRIVYRRRF